MHIYAHIYSDRMNEFSWQKPFAWLSKFLRSFNFQFWPT